MCRSKAKEVRIVHFVFQLKLQISSIVTDLFYYASPWKVKSNKIKVHQRLFDKLPHYKMVYCILCDCENHKAGRGKAHFLLFHMSWHLPGIAISHPFHKHQVQDVYSEAYTHMLYKSLKNISQTKATTELWFPTTAKKQFSDGEFIKECLLVWCIPIYVWILISHTGQCGGHTDVARKK